MPADNFAPSWSVLVTSLTRPVSLLRCSRCIDQSPPCQRGVPRQRRGGGIPWPRPRNLFTIHYSLFTKKPSPKKPSPFHIGLYFEEVPTVNPSVKNQRFLPAPFGKGAFLRPVSFYGAIAGLFRALNRQRGNKAVPKPTNPNGGRGKRLPPRAKAKGQSRMVPPGGFLRGEPFERERVVPPLSRLLCLLSCRGKKVRPRWQAPGVPPVSISLGS